MKQKIFYVLLGAILGVMISFFGIIFVYAIGLIDINIEYFVETETMENSSFEKNIQGQELFEEDFTDFIASLRDAVNNRNMDFIHSRVSNEFYLRRDFGDMYDPDLSHIENFSFAFQLDNSKWQEGFEDTGWKSFEEIINVNDFMISLEHETQTICSNIYEIEYDGDFYDSGSICFRRDSNGKYFIVEYIFGGD